MTSPPERSPNDAPIPRVTDPGGHEAPDPAAEEPVAEEESFELDTSDFERLSLVELPHIATYGKYELLGRLAFGGMAEIFLAREVGHEGSRRMMVVKRVLPHVAEDSQFVDMFRDEARLAMQLNHPQICHVYSFGEAEGTYYLAMEWVNGKPLSKIIRRAKEQGGLPIPIALKIIAQVAEALDYAHRATDAADEPLGIVHRDVSPQNIMVSYDGVVKLLDFGIAKAASHSTRTEAGVIKGKFAYMSPQQCVGEPIDARADIFALGICLFEALAGKNPFKRKTEFETMTKIVSEAAPSVREWREEVPDAVVEVVETCLMKQAHRRYQSAGDMQLALEMVIPTLGVLVNASRLGDYVSTLFVDEVKDGPRLDTRLSLPATATPSSMETGENSAPQARPRDATELDVPLAEEFAPRPAKKKSRSVLPWIGCGLFVLASFASGLAIFGWFLFLRPSDTSEPLPVSVVAEPASAPLVPPVVEPPPAAPTTGSALIESDPPGATVQLGSRHLGTTPVSVDDLEPGAHQVRLTLEGHEPLEAEITVVAGEQATLTRALARIERGRATPAGPARPPGRISVNTRPWSKVYVGRRLLGTTPIGRARVPSGTVRLRLVDRDGHEHRRILRVPAGGHVTQSYNLRQ